MTDKFPLFSLPYVALNEVLNHVRPEATLSLSLCSKRSILFVKGCQGPQKEININLNIPQNVLRVDFDLIISVNPVSILRTNLKTVNFGSHVVPVKMKDGILQTFWLDEKEGLKEVIKYTSDVFNRELYSISAYGGVSFNDVRDWLQWIKIRQHTLRELFLFSEVKVDDDLIPYILESGIVTGDLDLSTSRSSEFRGPAPRPYSIDHLNLLPSKWVTLNHLLAMDIKEIVLQYSPLTCQEMNVFLKKWINGECSKRIKVLHVGRNNANYDVLMEGIEVNGRDPRLRRVYAASYNGVEHIFGGFDIRRKEDGALATIVNQQHGMLTELKVVFWPDCKGNPYY